MNLITSSSDTNEHTEGLPREFTSSEARERHGAETRKAQAPALNVRKLLVGSTLSQRHRKEIFDLYRAKRFDELVGKIGLVLEKAPHSSPLLRILAGSLSGLDRPSDAADILVLACQQAPDCPEIVYQLADAYFYAGSFVESLRLFWQCVELSPQDPAPLIATARVLMETGQKDTAKACLLRAAPLSASDRELSHIAEIFAGLKDWNTAALLYQHVVELSPKRHENWVRLGAASFEAGKHDEAILALENAINLGADGKAVALLCRMLVSLHRPDQATAAAEAYLKSHPEEIDARFALGRSQEAALDLVAAHAAFKQVLQVAPNSPDALIKMGEMRYYLGDPEGAIDHWRTLIAIRPDLAIAHWNVASAYLSKGDFGSARQKFRDAFAADPDKPILAKSFVRLLNGNDLGALVESFARTAINPERPAKERVASFYGLAEAARLRDDPELVVSHLDAASAIYQEASGISIAAHQKALSKVRAAFDEPMPQADLKSVAPFTPIFIIGMPRSGTTLMEQILAADKDVSALGEISALELAIRRSGGLNAPPTHKQLNDIRELYFAQTQALAEGAPRFVTDKLPMNFITTGVIAAAFPEAKIIHMTRCAEAVCWSCYMSHFANKNLDYTFEQRALGQYYRLYEAHMEFWRQKLPSRIIDQSYEDLTEDPESTTKELFTKIGLAWDASVHQVEKSPRAVRTASLMQVRKPIYKGSSEAWRRYEAWLGPLLQELHKPRA